MTMQSYIFSTNTNSYFLGRDLIITRHGNGGSVRVNERDGMLSVDVKDGTIRHNWPTDVNAAADKIGETRVGELYEVARDSYWRWATLASAPHGFHVYQAGRSGGWLAVDGTQRLSVSGLIEPDEEDAELRDRFLGFAFEVVGEIDRFRAELCQSILSAANEQTRDLSHGARIIEDDEYGEEAVLTFHTGITLRTNAGPVGCPTFGGDYIRVVAPDGGEIGYWDKAEWAREPINVMGAIFGACAGSVIEPIDRPYEGV
jgi:hypothetical protein